MKVPARLLLIDARAPDLQPLREYLADHGFAVSGTRAEAADAAIARERPDAVLLDLGGTGEDGVLLARHLREHHDVGILAISSSPDVVDRIVALEVGADDCLSRPFDLRELLARLRSLVRRLHGQPAPEAPQPPAAPAAPAPLQPFGRCLVDLQGHRMFDADGAEIPLTAMEYQLVAAFLSNPNRVLTRDQLLMKSRQREWEPDDRSVDIGIGRLRRKVDGGRQPGGRGVIRTVRNAGYMFVPDAPATRRDA